MTAELIKKNQSLIGQFVTLTIKDAFKLMAKDESLSRFLLDSSEPAIVLDLQLMAQRESLDLAELALLELVDSSRWNEQLTLSARRIQERFQEAFGEKGAATYLAEGLIEERKRWIDLRAQFFRTILSMKVNCATPLDLFRESFRKADELNAWLEKLHAADELLAQTTIPFCPPILRFLLSKYFECERDATLRTGLEFSAEAFRSPAKLKGS